MPALLCFIFFILGVTAGDHYAEKTARTEAVKRGHAQWIVQPDGSTVFQWRENCGRHAP